MTGALLHYEHWVLGFVVLAALLFARPAGRVWGAVGRALDQVGRRPAAAVLITALLAAVGSGAAASFLQWPEPRIHDEFSYLLAADTYAHGRLTNPTHPQWRHLETYHVIHVPTYMSKYPPAQGLVLAAGQVLGGHPAVGLWLSAALLCGSLTWMLLGWLPGRWAVLGGLLGLLRFGVTTYWTQSYWGGALTAAGGALLFGGLIRVLHRSPHGRPTRDALLLALGLALLANSRPWEGLVTALPALVVLLLWRARLPAAEGPSVRRRVILPAALALSVVVAGMAYNNQAVTGDAFTLPYELHDADYSPPPPFLWSSLPVAVDYRHEPMRDFWRRVYLDEYSHKRTAAGFVEAVGRRAHNLWSFYLGWLLLLPALACLPELRRRRMRFAAAVSVLLFVVLTGSTYYGRHYYAPVTALVLLLVTAGCRRLAAWRPGGRPLGRALVLGLLLACGLRLAAHAWVMPLHPDAWHLLRARTLADLTDWPGQDLVIVRYGPDHDTAQEWVFNGADLEATEVLWARDLGDVANAELIEALPERRPWLLVTGHKGRLPELLPYADR